jgi:dolichol-phosphate mannosyltransferase
MLSVIIPVKDEPLIRELVYELNTELDCAHEIIIVDKSSVSLSDVHGASIIKQKTNGLGNAFLEGFSASKGDIVALMDGDRSHDPKDLAKMARCVGHADIVVGSKRVAGSDDHDHWTRKLTSTSLSAIIGIFLGIPVRDATSGFMVAKRSVIESVKLKPIGYKIVMELLYRTKGRKLNVMEYPITFSRRAAGKSKVGFNGSGLKEIFNIFALAIGLRLGIR